MRNLMWSVFVLVFLAVGGCSPGASSTPTDKPSNVLFDKKKPSDCKECDDCKKNENKEKEEVNGQSKPVDKEANTSK